MKTIWSLTKFNNKDGTAKWFLWNSETERGYDGAVAKRIASSLKKRGIKVENNIEFNYSWKSIGFFV